jgi:hypothetical protein
MLSHSETVAHKLSLRTGVRLQLKALRMIVDAPWCVPNMVIRRELQTPTVKEETHRYGSQYRDRLSVHPNDPTENTPKRPNREHTQTTQQ